MNLVATEEIMNIKLPVCEFELQIPIFFVQSTCLFAELTMHMAKHPFHDIRTWKSLSNGLNSCRKPGRFCYSFILYPPISNLLGLFVDWLFRFYVISSLLDYLMPNPIDTYIKLNSQRTVHR